MNNPAGRNWSKVGTFLFLTVCFTAPFWALVISAGTRNTAGGLYSTGGMWAVGLAAIATKIIYREPIRQLYLGWGPRLYLFWGVVLPLIYAAPVYVVAWATGLRDPPDVRVFEATAEEYGLRGVHGIFPWTLLALLVVIAAVVSALGEEIGWRGFLLPETLNLTSVPRAGLLVGFLWAAWHYPTILFADYGASTPLWTALPSFTVMAIALTFQMAWLWFQSRSVWPAVLLHASHNFWIQVIFDPITPPFAGPQYMLGEFGIGVATGSTAIAIMLYWLAYPLALRSRPTAKSRG